MENRLRPSFYSIVVRKTRESLDMKIELALRKNSLLPSLATAALRERSDAAFAGYLFLMYLYRVLEQCKVTVLIKAGNIELLRV